MPKHSRLPLHKFLFKVEADAEEVTDFVMTAWNRPGELSIGVAALGSLSAVKDSVVEAACESPWQMKLETAPIRSHIGFTLSRAGIAVVNLSDLQLQPINTSDCMEVLNDTLSAARAEIVNNVLSSQMHANLRFWPNINDRDLPKTSTITGDLFIT